MSADEHDSDLLPPPTVEQEQTVDALDIEDAEFCCARRDELIELAQGQQERREENESQDRIGAATIAKLYDTALKWHRAAREIRDRRREIEHDRMLIAHELEMSSRGFREAPH